MRLLPSSNPSLNCGPHLPVVRAVILFPSAHVLDDLSVDFSPQIIRNRVLICRVIVVQYAYLLQLGESADDLLKSAIDSGPCFIDYGFCLMQFHISFLFWQLSDISDRSEASYKRKSECVKGEHRGQSRQEAPLLAGAGGIEPRRDGSQVRD